MALGVDARFHAERPAFREQKDPTQVDEQIVHQLAGHQVYALSAEAVAWPKPGLVTAVDTGCHKDMNVYTFLKSAVALYPSFCEAFRCGWNEPGEEALFSLLRYIGKIAEMNLAMITNGINTHRGAIFFGVLLAGVAGRQLRHQPSLIAVDICKVASTIAIPALKADLHEAEQIPDVNLSSGLQAFRRFGITGARGEVIGGFQSVLKHGLPALQCARSCGCDERWAMVHTLLSLMAVVDDSTVLNRNMDPQRLERVRSRSRDVLTIGSVFTSAGRSALQCFGRELAAQEISPGGSADLMAVTLYLDAWHSMRPGL